MTLRVLSMPFILTTVAWSWAGLHRLKSRESWLKHSRTLSHSTWTVTFENIAWCRELREFAWSPTDPAIIGKRVTLKIDDAGDGSAGIVVVLLSAS